VNRLRLYRIATAIPGLGRLAAPLLAAALALAAGPGPAQADKVHDLSRALLRGKSEKARISAAVSLGRLGDPRALKPLIRALDDDSNVVRALAAAALGRLGDPAALPALERARNDRDSTVRRRVAEAIASIKKSSTPAGRRALARRARRQDHLAHYAIAPRERRAPIGSQVFVVLKSAQDKTAGRMAARARKLRADHMRSLMASELRRNREVTLLSTEDGDLGVEPYSVDVTILKLDRLVRGPYVEIECELRVAVSDDRGKMLSVMTGGAKVQVPRRTFQRKYEAQFKKEALENAVKSVHQDLVSYLRKRPS